MIEYVEALPSELDAQPFVNLGGLVEVHIPLHEMGPPEGVATTSTDSAVGWQAKDCCTIRNHVGVGVAVLVAGLGQAIGPLKASVLPGIVKSRAKEDRKATPAGITCDAAHLPARSKPAES